MHLSEEAEARLRAQKRNSTISSILVSIMVVVGIFMVLGIFLLPIIEKETPPIVAYAGTMAEDVDIKEPKPTKKIQKKPAAPANAISRVIASNRTSATSIPVPDVDFSTPSADFGDAQDFGTGWGDVSFASGAAGGGGGFGSTSADSGGLPGLIYDLKQSSKGKPLNYQPSAFMGIALELIEEKFKSSAFRDYYQAPTPLFLTRLAVPTAPADEGPAFFKAEKEIEPRGWIAHYRGEVIVPETGSYRFSGGGDDFLHVMVNGKTVFNYYKTFESLDNKLPGYKPVQPSVKRKPVPFTTAGWWIRYGEWIDLKEGQRIQLDIAAGEEPGGKVGFLLQLEKKGVDYEVVDGNPILPLFTTVAISKSEEKELREQYGNYKLDFDNVLVFPMN